MSLQKIRWFNQARRNYGLKNAIKATKVYLGFNDYTTLKLPYLNSKVTVLTDNQWFGLEKDVKEHECLKQTIKTVQAGMTALDIGTHIGTYTLMLSKLVGEKGRVYGFEPSPKPYKILRENLKRNHCENVTAENIALSNTCGKVTLYNPSDLGASGSSILLSGKGKATTVDCTTIDDYCQEHNVKPEFLKMDVEGAESLLIEGARKTLVRYHPSLLLEFHAFKSREENLADWRGIIENAKPAVFLDGVDDTYSSGDIINELPKGTFHAYIKYTDYKTDK
jgi:FkbM family methyltransferase